MVSAEANSKAQQKIIQSQSSAQHADLSLHQNCPEQESEQVKVEPHCSGSVCLLKMASVRSIINPIEQPQSLALIQTDTISKPIIRAQLLYRPPIS